MEKINEILNRDAYKGTHWLQLKKKYEHFVSYMEARKGAKHPYVYMIGLSWLIQNHYSDVPTMFDINEAEDIMLSANGANYFNREVWEKIHNLGYYPMVIKGLPEGTKAPIGTPLFTIEPTEDWFASTCNGEETKLMRSWYPMALVTRLKILYEELTPIFERNGCLDLLDFSIIGFESRSATSTETSDLAGMFSLFVNRSSDNLSGQRKLNRYYKGGEDRLKTVWATEHACALSYGPDEGEYDYVKAQLDTHTKQVKSIVIDTFDTENFVDNVLTRSDVMELIMAHEGRIVLRNDSGDMSEKILYILNSLKNTFGYTLNENNKIVISGDMGVMQADGVNEVSIPDLYRTIENAGFCPSNLVNGGGNGLMFENLTRDYNRNAIKPSVNTIDGVEINVNKVVKSDPTKGSKPGRLKVDKDLVTHSSVDYTAEEFENIKCIMVPFYKNGEILINDFDTVYKELNK